MVKTIDTYHTLWYSPIDKDDSNGGTQMAVTHFTQVPEDAPRNPVRTYCLAKIQTTTKLTRDSSEVNCKRCLDRR